MEMWHWRCYGIIKDIITLISSIVRMYHIVILVILILLPLLFYEQSALKMMSWKLWAVPL